MQEAQVENDSLRLSRRERVLLAVTVALALSALALKPVLRFAWPELAVECALRHRQDVDPWGRPWVNDLKMGFAMACRSVGPNGVDEGGGGDDINGTRGSLSFAADPDHLGWNLLGLVLSPFVLAGASIFFGWLLAASRFWSAPRGSDKSEALRAGLIAVLPIAVICWVAVLVAGQPGFRRFSADLPLLVPGEIALAGTLSGAAFLIVLWWRLGRPVVEGD